MKNNKKWYSWYVALPIGVLCYIIYFALGGASSGAIPTGIGMAGGILILCGIINMIVFIIKSVNNRLSKNVPHQK
jgi:hypothetical protein